MTGAKKQDSGENRSAEAALRAIEQKYRSLVETTDTGYVIIDSQGLVLDANQEYVRLTGRNSLAAVIGQSVLEWTAPYDHARNALEVRKCAEQGFVRNLEIDYVTPSGKVIPVEINATILRTGEEIVILTLCRDITERKHAETALRESEERFKSIVFATPMGIHLYELKDNGRLVFIGANPAAEEMLGVDHQGFIGKSIEEAFPGLIDTEVPRRYREAASFGTSWKTEQIDYDEGKIRGAFEVIAFQVGPQKVAAMFNEITARMKAEAEKERLQAQLLQAQKMESIGRLAGGVAHDFNNMLGIILGYAELVQRQIAPGDPRSKGLAEIINAANRSADLTRQLLAFARKQAVTPKVLELNDTISGMIKMLGRLIGEEIELIWQPGAAMGLVRIDPSQLDQILANLCVNAKDAITGRGKITIETANLTIGVTSVNDLAESAPGGYVVLVVADDGCGMTKDVLNNIFEPFFTTKGVGHGTGLGLAMVYGIVKQNGGFINVNSTPGMGATFKIFLPRYNDKAVYASEAIQAAIFSGGPEIVLLVEDELMMLEAGTHMLESLGYKVLPASTPGEAIRLAEVHAGEIQLLMTDVVMPEMNGRDLAKRLLSLYPNLKRLFMSGYPTDVIAPHGVLAEGVHFIQKPFSLKELAEAVRAALEE